MIAFQLYLSLGYNKSMRHISRAARMLGQRSFEARMLKWGKREFLRRMREWGKLGGRPPKKKSERRKKHYGSRRRS